MSDKLISLRNWLMLKLAGNSTFIINAYISDGTIIIEKPHSFMANTIVERTNIGIQLGAEPVELGGSYTKIIGSGQSVRIIGEHLTDGRNEE